MHISNSYWHFPAALTPQFCDDVIANAHSQDAVMDRTVGYGERKLTKGELQDIKRTRTLELISTNKNSKI